MGKDPGGDWFGERTLMGQRAGSMGAGRNATVRAVGNVRLLHIERVVWNLFFTGQVATVVAKRVLAQMVAEFELLAGAGHGENAEAVAAHVEWLAAEHELDSPHLSSINAIRSESLKRAAPRKTLTKAEMRERNAAKATRSKERNREMGWGEAEAAREVGGEKEPATGGRRASIQIGGEEFAGLLSPTKKTGGYVGAGDRGRRRSVTVLHTGPAASGPEQDGGSVLMLEEDEAEQEDAAAAATAWAAEMKRARAKSSRSGGGPSRKEGSSRKSSERKTPGPRRKEGESEEVVIGRSGRRRRSVV
jgi:hypothetical protein